MANSLQARKRARQADKRRTHNQGRRSMMRTSLKKALAAIESGNREEAEALFRSLRKGRNYQVLHQDYLPPTVSVSRTDNGVSAAAMQSGDY